jgi:hypothetical protein
MADFIHAPRQERVHPRRGRGLRAAVATVKARRAMRSARGAADAELALARNAPLRLAWRVEELVSTKSRLDLAHSLRSVVRNANARYLPSATPVNRLAVRAESDRFETVASRLAELDRPVSARGVVLLQRLLLDSGGPLYDVDQEDELAEYLEEAGAALEPR